MERLVGHLRLLVLPVVSLPTPVASRLRGTQAKHGSNYPRIILLCRLLLITLRH